MKKLIFGLIATVMFSNFSFSNSTLDGKNNVVSFLNTYYTSYNLGKSIETKANNQSVVVSEILDKNNGTINGYVAVNKENNELLYFVDYMKNTQEIKTIDFSNNQTDIIDLKKDNKFENFIKIDLIKEIEKVNLDPNISYRKFWGKECGSSWTTPTGECYRTCTYYVFWLENGTNIEGC